MSDAREEKHEGILERLYNLSRRPAGFKAAEIREVASEAHEWLRTVMIDLRGHEAAAGYAKPSPVAEAGLREAAQAICDALTQWPDGGWELRGDDPEILASNLSAALSTRPAGESAGVTEALEAVCEAARHEARIMNSRMDPETRIGLFLRVDHVRALAALTTAAPTPDAPAKPGQGGKGARIDGAWPKNLGWFSAFARKHGQHEKADWLDRHRAALSAPPSDAALRSDKARLDWLEEQVVEVRTPLVHGSRGNFFANPDDSREGETGPSNLRAQVDAAIAPSAPRSPADGTPEVER